MYERLQIRRESYYLFRYSYSFVNFSSFKYYIISTKINEFGLREIIKKLIQLTTKFLILYH